MIDNFMDKHAGFWWFVWWIGIIWVNLQQNINYIHGIIMEATVNNIQVNVITVANAGVVKETTYQKLKRLSKKYNLQTNDPKFARVWIYRDRGHSGQGTCRCGTSFGLRCAPLSKKERAPHRMPSILEGGWSKTKEQVSNGKWYSPRLSNDKYIFDGKITRKYWLFQILDTKKY